MPAPHAASGSTPPLIVCPCESVTSREIEHAIAELGCQDVNEVKKITRAGMGPCQGTVCHRLVEVALGRAVGPAAAAVPHRFRPPVRPVPLARLARWAAEMPEPEGTVDADVLWGVKAGARGTLPLDLPWRGAGD